MRTRNILATLLAGAGLAACAAAPDNVAPTPAAPTQGEFISTARSDAVTAQAPQSDWWRLYQDPVLDRLIEDALAANTDVRVAVARIERARASLRGARADRLPSTDIGATANYGRYPTAQTLPGLDRERRSVDGGIEIGYELDLFGRVSRGIEAATGDWQAAREDADAVRVTVVADTVRAYVEAAANARRIAVARETIELLDRSLRITSARAERGLSDNLDVIRLQQLREQQAAEIPPLMAERETALFQLATLTGRAPSELPKDAAARDDVPEIAQPIPVGDSRQLLARRPDVRAAERRLAADTARNGVATADLYPRISFGASAGTTALGATDVFSGGALRWLVGPLLSWAFPNQEAIRARIGQSRADAAADLAAFDGTVLRALEEVETALTRYRNAILRQQSLEQARDAAERAARASLARQRVGRIDFLAVLDAQRTQASADLGYAESRRAVAIAQVDLFRALGGRWDTNGGDLRSPRSP